MWQARTGQQQHLTWLQITVLQLCHARRACSVEFQGSQPCEDRKAGSVHDRWTHGVATINMKLLCEAFARASARWRAGSNSAMLDVWSHKLSPMSGEQSHDSRDSQQIWTPDQNELLMQMQSMDIMTARAAAWSAIPVTGVVFPSRAGRRACLGR